MTLRLITAPADMPVTLDEAKAHLRVDGDHEDALIGSLIRAALAHAEKWCGQPFQEQTWEQVLDAFPAAEIDLEIGPVASVTSVKYDDGDGEQTVDGADYEVDTVSRSGWVVPAAGFAWPTALDGVSAVRVRFVVGTSAPLEVKQAILLMIGFWFESREAAEMPGGAYALLNLHRRMFA
ncbi:MAG TPA: head-tail connector protein [Amaricoccus sp.]|uniref:head-tail connector protein n=1 Tax=Amaricoccus sp. TaxID=1872485 RepID=UPI002CB5F899|nr:head-tail connector protein [Amaricoccus sp.]HMR51199.1 head-tail connector protein [Amaricoccus sp.]HMT98052.1 head-tail connector protein [Amaricoccus sp.]